MVKCFLFKSLESLKNLRTLYLNNNNINEIKGIGTLVNIQKLYLDNDNISEIKGLENFDKLVYLRIDNNPIPNKLLDELGFKDGAAYKPRNVVEYCIT